MKKVIAIGLCAAMLGTMLAGCGSSTTTESDTTAKTKTTTTEGTETEGTETEGTETEGTETEGIETEDTKTASEAPSGGEIDWSSMTIAWSPANLSNELQVTLTDSLTESFSKLGAEFLSSDPQGEAVTQVEQVENFISRGVDMILMSPTDAEACGVVVTEAKEAGIPMIIVNCMLNNIDEALCYVGCNDTDAGELLMKYVVDDLGGSGNIAILRGPDGLDAAIKRTAGFDTVLKENTGITAAASQAADWKTDLAMSTVENWLQTMQLNAVVCENDEMAVGAVEAIVGQGYSCKDIKVYGIDGIPSAYASINSGEGMTATLLQNATAIAEKTSEVVVTYFEKGSVDSEYIIPWEVVDGSNIADYYSE